jgi:hypothetical protein
MKRTILSLCVAIAFLGFALQSYADVVFTSPVHMWWNTDPTQTFRMFRDGIPSVFPTIKPFPGTYSTAGTYYYQTYNITSSPTDNQFIITPLQEDEFSFFSIYSLSYDPTDLILNYLGDQGASGVSSVFSVPVLPNTPYVIVANSVSTALEHTYQFQVENSSGSVPEPSTFLLFGAGLGGLAFLRRKAHK